MSGITSAREIKDQLKCASPGAESLLTVDSSIKAGAYKYFIDEVVRGLTNGSVDYVAILADQGESQEVISSFPDMRMASAMLDGVLFQSASSPVYFRLKDAGLCVAIPVRGEDFGTGKALIVKGIDNNGKRADISAYAAVSRV